MSSSNEQQQSAGPAADPTADEIAAARALLADIDARVFATAATISPMEHVGLIRQAARRLFGHGS
jgi:hypothetical protein